MNQPTPPPLPSPHRVTNPDIAATDDSPPSPAAPTSPVRLSYAVGEPNKRVASPTRPADAISSPPKNRRDTRASPKKRSNGNNPSSSESVYDLFAVESTPARTSPRGVEVTLSPERSKRLSSIIDTIRRKPLRSKRAILPVRKTPKPVNKRAPKKKTAPAAKKSAPKKPGPRKSILTSALLTDLRPEVFTGQNISENYSKEDMNAFDGAFAKQLKFRFDERRQRRKNEGGVTTRAANDIDLSSEETVIQTTNFKELSRYILEDVLRCKEDTTLLLCIAKDLDSAKAKIPSDAAKQQRQSGVAGDECRIGGRDYICLKVELAACRSHLELLSGAMQMPELRNKYNEYEGFVVRISGTDDGSTRLEGMDPAPYKLTFAWRDLVETPKDILFFGAPFNTTRPFDPVFRMKNSVNYVHHVFRNLVAEYWGDASASAQLYAAYLKRRLEITEQTLETSAKDTVVSLIKSFGEMNRTQKVFCALFDGLCKNEFWMCVSNWNDYGTIAEKDYIAVKAASDSRVERKRAAAKFIVAKVQEMSDTSGVVIGTERTDVLPSPWSDTVHNLRPSYYKKK